MGGRGLGALRVPSGRLLPIEGQMPAPIRRGAKSPARIPASTLSFRPPAPPCPRPALPRQFYEGKCQGKYLSAELKAGETSCWHSAPCCALCRCAVPVRCAGALDVTSQPRWSRDAGWVIRFSPLQQRRRRPSGGGRRLLVSAVWLSLLIGRVVQNGPERSRARR
jgi:hypothetical protein